LLLIWIWCAFLSGLTMISINQSVADCIFIPDFRYGLFFYFPGILSISIFIIYNYLAVYLYLKSVEDSSSKLALLGLCSYSICIILFLYSSFSILSGSFNLIFHIFSLYILKCNSLINRSIFLYSRNCGSIFCHHWNVIFRSNRIYPAISVSAEPFLENVIKTEQESIKIEQESIKIEQVQESIKLRVTSETVIFTPSLTSPVSHNF
jgi:hypothetical protein